MIYHYTDLNALINIVRQDKIILRATNILYLNDPRELKEGISVINRIQGNNIGPESFRSYYITSFSECIDNLSMWGMYAANGNGCALGFDLDKIKGEYWRIIRCIYGKNEIKQNFNNPRKLILSENSVSFSSTQLSKEDEDGSCIPLVGNDIIILCLSAKNKAYCYEREVRGFIFCKDNIQFRLRNGYIIPYIEVPISRSALKEIVIGPTINSTFKMRSIAHFLDINGYTKDDIKLTVSSIPYRE